ncbi:MAG: outer membrane lipid asymmetry maintenance protein MlaD [Parvibaculaceae bacterium]|nr:outer membrane lipid asymmetry maintenance protein MlaD [Parvibaculaceae bacterium]
MQNNLVETLIGAVVIAVAAVFLFYGYSTANVHGGGGYTVSAMFDRVDGLTTGSDVRISGIKVGTVSSQSLDPKSFEAVVNMSIDPSVKIPDDSNAKITSNGLLGNNYVSITPGGSTDALTNGGEIEYTQGSVDLMGLISQAVFSTKGGDDKGAKPGNAPETPSGNAP